MIFKTLVRENPRPKIPQMSACARANKEMKRRRKTQATFLSQLRARLATWRVSAKCARSFNIVLRMGLFNWGRVRGMGEGGCNACLYVCGNAQHARLSYTRWPPQETWCARGESLTAYTRAAISHGGTPWHPHIYMYIHRHRVVHGLPCLTACCNVSGFCSSTACCVVAIAC